jgi:uncharacterized protein (TIGR02266 family)
MSRSNLASAYGRAALRYGAMGSERRSHPRVPLRLLVQFRLHDVDEFMRDHAVNLSVGGMFISTRNPWAKGSLVYLQFRVADGGTLIEGLAKVVHVNPPGSKQPGMGVEFESLDEESREFIDATLASLVPGPRVSGVRS